MPMMLFVFERKNPVDRIELLDVGRIRVGEVGGRRVLREQRRRHHVDALVGGLRRQDRRDEQLERVAVVQCAAHIGIEVAQPAHDLVGAVRAPRGRAMGREYPRPMSTPTVVAVPPSGFADLLEAAHRIDDEVAARTGHPALGDAVWRDFAQPGPDSLGLLVDDIAFAHVARSDTFAPQHWTVGLALTPGARRVAIAGALIDAAVAHVAAHGGGNVVLWVFAATDEDDASSRRRV